jgi:hypothetical protein
VWPSVETSYTGIEAKMQHCCGKWRPLFALFAAIALSPPLPASDNPNCPFSGCGSQPDDRVLALPVRALTFDLKALDSLQPSNFVVKDGKSRIGICGVTHDRQPVSVGIVLDISTSMRGSISDLAAIARAGVGKLLDTSQPDDEYFLEYVKDVATMQCGFGCDLQQIRDNLQIHRKGKTALIDGLLMALREMSKAHHANRVLLLVSDGLENRSVHKFKELERASADLPVPLFLLVPAEHSHPPDGEELEARNRLLRLVSHSGGYNVAVFDAKEAIAVVTGLASVIRSPYVLYFARPRQSVGGLDIAVKDVRPRPRIFYGPAFVTCRGPAAASHWH